MKASRWKTMIVAIAAVAMPMVTIATCDQTAGTIKIYRDDDSDSWDDDHYYEDDFVYYDDPYYYDDVYYHDIYYGYCDYCY